MRFDQLFARPKPIIAMVHVFEGELQHQLDQALEDAQRLQQGGVDALLVENYGWGYTDANRCDAQTADRIARIGADVWSAVDIPVGINLLPNDFECAFKIAELVGASFIQMDHVTGRFRGCEPVSAERLAAVRSAHPNIAVLGGIHPKYYTLLDPACTLTECAGRAQPLTEAVVVTGDRTGGETSLEDLRVVREALAEHHIVIGSGLMPDNAFRQLLIADGAIVGSAFKRGGVRPGEPVDLQLVRCLMEQVDRLR